MKKVFFTVCLFITVACCDSVFAQAFLKTYTDPANLNTPVSFECITEKTDSVGNFYIGGHIGDTITLFRINTSGVVLATFKIKTSPANTKLDAIMIAKDPTTLTDKVVVLGNVQASSGNQGFMFRFDPPTATVDWFRQSDPAANINYWDMTDKTGNYYVVSAQKRADGSALILRIDKILGVATVALNYSVNGLEDPEAIQLYNSKIYATGRYSLPGGGSSGNGFRYCFTRINTNTFPYTHLSTYYYAEPKYPQATARMYSTDILIGANPNAAIIVGHGDDNNDADPFKNIYITKVNFNNGVPTWSKKYDDPFAASDGALTEIRFDNTNNYIVMGFAYDANTFGLGRAKLWKVNQANGNLLWNRQYDFYRRTANNTSADGYGFTVNGNYIYAVGQDRLYGTSKGVLLKVNTADGNVTANDGTNCYDTLTLKISKYTFYDSIPVILKNNSFTTTKPAKSVIKIKMRDSLSCGDTSYKCNCNLTLIYEGNNSVDTVGCKDTIKAVCGTNTLYNPSLTCTDRNTQLIAFTLKDANGNIPSWAASFTGMGALQVPSNVSGIFTLTYIWGANGVACDSCKIYLVVTCCPTTPCTLTTSIAYPPRGKKLYIKCQDTASLSCNNNYTFSPVLNCNNSPQVQINYVTLIDGSGNVPSWANTFLSNLGSGSLNIPNNVYGYFTLKYYWGIGGRKCDSCSYILKILCCTVTVNAGQDLVTCCPSAGTQINAQVSNANAPYFVSWSPTTGLSNPNIVNPVCYTTGTYVITVSDANGCVAKDTIKISYSGVNCCRMAGSKTKAQVFPNPFKDGFTVKLPANVTADIKVVNVQGLPQEIKTTVSGSVSLGKTLNYGVYTIVVQYNNGSKEEIKVIKNPE